MLLDPARERDLLANLRARRGRQLDLRQIRLDAQHTPTGRRRADVDEQELVLHELRDLGLFLVFCFHAEKAPEEEEADLQLCVRKVSANRLR